MTLPPEAIAGLTGNINLGLKQSIENIQKVDRRNTKINAADLLVKQLAVQTIVLATIAQLLLAQVEETRIVVSH